MNPNYIYVEPSFWVASTEDERTVKQLCVELEEKLNASERVENWSDFVRRCKECWELASCIAIERYPVAQPSESDPFPLVPASSKVMLKNVATSTEFLDVPSLHYFKNSLNAVPA